VFSDTNRPGSAIFGANASGAMFDSAQTVMGTTWDGRERRRGQRPDELRGYLRDLQTAWDAEHPQIPADRGKAPLDAARPLLDATKPRRGTATPRRRVTKQ
jgi:hypothetical protein